MFLPPFPHHPCSSAGCPHAHHQLHCPNAHDLSTKCSLSHLLCWKHRHTSSCHICLCHCLNSSCPHAGHARGVCHDLDGHLCPHALCPRHHSCLPAIHAPLLHAKARCPTAQAT